MAMARESQQLTAPLLGWLAAPGPQFRIRMDGEAETVRYPEGADIPDESMPRMRCSPMPSGENPQWHMAWTASVTTPVPHAYAANQNPTSASPVSCAASSLKKSSEV